METTSATNYMGTAEAQAVWGVRTRNQVSSYCRKYKDSIGAYKDSRGKWRIPIDAMPPVSIGALRSFLFDYLKTQNCRGEFLYTDDVQELYWAVLLRSRLVILQESNSNQEDSYYVISQTGWDFLLDKSFKEKRFAISLSLFSFNPSAVIASL